MTQFSTTSLFISEKKIVKWGQVYKSFEWKKQNQNLLSCIGIFKEFFPIFVSKYLLSSSANSMHKPSQVIILKMAFNGLKIQLSHSVLLYPAIKCLGKCTKEVSFVEFGLAFFPH